MNLFNPVFKLLIVFVPTISYITGFHSKTFLEEEFLLKILKLVPYHFVKAGFVPVLLSPPHLLHTIHGDLCRNFLCV